MGLSEFENEMKRRLEERTIVPSESAWEKLAGQLDDTPAKRSYVWFYRVAAVLVIGIVISIAFFRETPNGGTTVVRNDAHKPLIETPKSGIRNVQDTPVQQQYVADTPENAKDVSAENGGARGSNLNGSQTPGVAETIKPKLKVSSSEDSKVNEIVNTLALMQKQGTEITDAMVDSMLIKAQRELANERRNAMMANNTSVDAMAQVLLEEVEHDLDRSFKDKVFDALQASFVKVKTAVAERNQ